MTSEKELAHLLALFAHKLKSPLHGLGMNVEVVRSRCARLSPEIAAALLPFVNAIEQDLMRMQLITRRFLELLDSPVIQLQKTSLTRLIHKSLNDLRTHLPQNIILEHSGLEDRMRIDTDERIFLAAISELFHNAIEAMPGGGKLIVFLKNAKKPTLEIRDDGPGIPAKELQKVFEPFYTTKNQHAGMGLTIARELLKSIHCPLELRNNSTGGISAIISIPATKA